MSPQLSKNNSKNLSSDRLDELRNLQMSVDVHVIACGKTDPGNVRHINEDNLLLALPDLNRRVSPGESLKCTVGPSGVLLAVADGMGGNLAGEVASDLALQSLAEEWAVRTRQRPIADALCESVQASNERVWQAWQNNPAWRGMGTTLTAVLILGRQAYVVEVGDSRCYLIRNHRIKQVTKDQSLVELLVDSGHMSRSEAHITGGSVVLQAIGLHQQVEVEEISLDLKQNDWLILCTDGLYNQITDKEIKSVIKTEKEPHIISEKLVALAKNRGAPDNVTVIVVQVFGSSLGTPQEHERVTNSLHRLYEYDPIGSGEISLDDLSRFINTRRERHLKTHTSLLVGYGLFLLLAVIFILYKAMGF